MQKILWLLIFIPMLNAQDFTIKSIKTYTGNEQAAFPVLLPGKNSLTIRFEIEAEYTPNLSIVFRYCDKDWNPTNSIFLLNPGYDIYNNIDFEKLPSNLEHADYFHESRFPDKRGLVNFPHSGKWMYFITDNTDTSKIYASGKFFVIDPALRLNVKLKKELLEDKVYTPQALGRVFDITTEFELPQEFFPGFVSHVEIIENQKIEYPYVINRDFNTTERHFYWNGNNKFSFTARDIRPGNGYRQADIRNYNRFIGDRVNAQPDKFEYSNFYKQRDNDLNGGSILLPASGNEAIYGTYHDVVFTFRPPAENMGDIFLTGAFNNWTLLPEYKMEYRGGLYTKTVNLKRGVYDYAYAAADVINGEITNVDRLVLEGNFWETVNEYHIFLYYRDPNYGGYDRVIGYYKLLSR